MLPNSRLFRSRWTALIWAAGIVWLALNVAGTGKGSEGAKNEAAADADTRQAINVLESMN
jgi:hypothetical protein